MMEPVNPMTHCNHCRSPLSHDKERNCKVCRTCHPVQEIKTEPLPKDVATNPNLLTFEERVEKILAKHESVVEERIREIVRDELENWHIHEPSVKQDDVDAIWQTETAGNTNTATVGRQAMVSEVAAIQLEPDWRAQAKELGIPLFQRKKVDVLADIEAKKEIAETDELVAATGQRTEAKKVAD